MLKFDFEYVQKVQRCMVHVDHIYNTLRPLFQVGQWGKRSFIRNTLFYIREYALANAGHNPPSDRDTIIKYTEAHIFNINKARTYARNMFQLLQPVKRSGLEQQYQAIQSLLKEFGEHLRRQMKRAENDQA